MPEDMRPQDWITTALDGFLAEHGHELPPGVKGALVAKMTLACAGIQGEVEVEPFRQLLGAGGDLSARERADLHGTDGAEEDAADQAEADRFAERD